MYKVKVISLARRQDRRDKFTETFSKLFPFEYVDAIDGRDYTLTDYDKEFIKGNDYEDYGIHIPSLVAANYTHLNLLQECSEGDIPFVILEDDAKLVDKFDLDFEKLSKKSLDVFWLMPNEPSILAYMVWPTGAQKLLERVFNEYKLSVGLDWTFFDIRNEGNLIQEEVKKEVFYQIPGEDSDITTLLNYKVGE